MISQLHLVLLSFACTNITDITELIITGLVPPNPTKPNQTDNGIKLN